MSVEREFEVVVKVRLAFEPYPNQDMLRYAKMIVAERLGFADPGPMEKHLRSSEITAVANMKVENYRP